MLFLTRVSSAMHVSQRSKHCGKMPQDNQAPEMPANTTSVCGTDGNWLNLLDVFVPLFLFYLFLLFKAYGQFSDLSHHLDHT